MTLNELNLGDKAEILEVGGEDSLRQRLMDLGLAVGTRLCCVLESPQKDPKAYEIKGAVIAIRRV